MRGLAASLALSFVAATAAARPAALAVRIDAGADAIVRTLPAQSARALRPPRVAARRDTPRAAAAAAAAHAVDTWRVLEFADAAARDAALLQFAAAGVVAEPVRTFALCGASSAEFPPNILQVRAPEAVAAIVPDTTVVVAVIDSGSDLGHPDLVRRLWRNDDPPGNASSADDAVDQDGDGAVSEWERDDDDDNGYVDDLHGFDFTDAPAADAVGDALGRDADPSDEQGHGTHVAGILCADGVLRGVAPFVRLLTVRAAYTTPFGGGVLETDDAAAAIVYAVDNGARVLNLSWGDTVESRLIRDAVDYALASDCVVVAAAGNRGSDAPHWPSSQPGVVSVGGVDRTGARAGFSNFGPGVTLVAPGEVHSGFDGGILSLALGGRQARLRGTSMAAPHVAGAAAILASRPGHPSSEQIRAWLVAGARRATTADWDANLAHGLLDCLTSVRTRDDLVVQVHGPPRAFERGRVTLLGTLLGADIVRWRIDARAREGSDARVLHDWTPRRADAETLVSQAFAPAPDGDWEWTLGVETGDGRRHERHGRFGVDFTPPRADSIGVTAAFRGTEPRWLVTAASDEEFALEVAQGPGDTLRAAEAGFAPQTQLETAPRSGTAAEWKAILTDVARNQTFALVPAPPVLAAWPRDGSLEVVDSTSAFAPEPVAAPSPDGTTVVWGRERANATGTLQAWGIVAGRWTLQHDTGFTLRPVAAADVNGDGGTDVLGLRPGTGTTEAVWLVTRAAGTWPDSVARVSGVERALGCYQLDADPEFETLLSSRDSLFVHDDLRAGGGARVQTLVDPATTGFRVFGADAAVGDLFGDGGLAIAIGDAEGDVVVYARRPDGRFALATVIDTGGTYAYDLEALPGGGIAVGCQRTRDVAGDGFPHAVHEFIAYRPQAAGFVRDAAVAVLAPTNALGAGLAIVADASSAAWWAFVRGADFYLARASTAGLEARTYRGDGGADSPLLEDLDADGGLDVVWRSGGVARWARVPGQVAGPRDLTSESLGPDRLRLDWRPADFAAGTSRVRRAQGGGFVTLGETTAGAWIDSTLAPGVDATYEIEGLDAGMVRARSNRIVTRAQALPRLVALAALGPASLRVRCTNPLGASALQPDAWRVEVDAGVPLRVVQVSLAEAGRSAHLVLDSAPVCGRLRLRIHDARDDRGGRFAPEAAAVETEIVCAAPPFLVRAVAARAAAIDVEFSRAVDAATVPAAAFEVDWDDATVPVLAAAAIDSATVRLTLESALVGRGIPYRIRVGNGVRARDGAALARPGSEYWLRVEGAGIAALFVYPNPARTGATEVVFAEASATTRVRIYDLEGQLVAELGGAQGGGLRWNLRGRDGRRVASGTYIYIASDGVASRRGHVVVAQ